MFAPPPAGSKRLFAHLEDGGVLHSALFPFELVVSKRRAWITDEAETGWAESAAAEVFAPFIAAMKTQSTPCRLVGIGSVAGIRGMRGAGAYCASKAALHS